MSSNAQIQSQLGDVWKYLTEEERDDLKELISARTDIWEPQVGPQSEAVLCGADILFYGGQAGGGKTSMLIGLSQTQHYKTAIFRREGKEHTDIILDSKTLATRRGKYNFNGQDNILTTADDRIVEFLSCKDAGTEVKFQGRVHDLKAFDEITHFLESQFRFLMGWNRSVDPRVTRTRVICTGNPPTDSDGEWVIKFWGPWLDPNHPNPAEPGELRWYVTYDSGVEQPVDGPERLRDPGTAEWVEPTSRTFIPSSVDDNMFLAATGYKRTLQALPEPLRSQMLKGDFQAGIDDDPWQVLPSSWVQAAMDRWVMLSPHQRGTMDSMGVDVARGGQDKTCIATRYGGWYDEIQSYPGKATPTGAAVASLCVQHLRDASPIHVDVIGVGTSAYDHLYENGLQVIGVNAAAKSMYMDKTGLLSMRNKRSELYWQMRECLDPLSDSTIALPPDAELKADLCSPRWKLSPNGVQVESKEELIKRIGRSPDKGDAALLAHIVTLREADYEEEYDNSAADKSSVTGY